MDQEHQDSIRYPRRLIPALSQEDITQVGWARQPLYRGFEYCLILNPRQQFMLFLTALWSAGVTSSEERRLAFPESWFRPRSPTNSFVGRSGARTKRFVKIDQVDDDLVLAEMPAQFIFFHRLVPDNDNFPPLQYILQIGCQ